MQVRAMLFLLGIAAVSSFRALNKLYSSAKLECSKTSLFLFEGALEDFVGKKYGAGQYFYGVRTSNEQQLLQKQITLRPNAVLVVGAPESSFCQSVLIELLEKGFAVRYACDDSTKAFQILGPSGHNFDIVELHKGSFFGRASSEKDFAVAIQDIQAIVLCQLKEDLDLYTSLSQKILDISARAQQAGVLRLKKIVLVSCAAASSGAPAASTAKQLQKSNTEFVVVLVPTSMISSKVGSADELEVRSAAAVSPSAESSFQSVVTADLAEVTVQVLLQDIASNTTISVHSANSGNKRSLSKRVRREAFYRLNSNTGYNEEDVSVEKASRDAACRQLKAWGAVRPIDQIRKQLAEDEAVERYWMDKFKAIAKK